MTVKDSPRKISRLSTPRSASTAARWQAVVNRDPTIDHFVYGVRTTGIYCRPSCPARLARRANVTFYDIPSQAEAAGFRACKRCKPASANPQKELVRKACTAIESEIRAGGKPRLQKLADGAGLTPSHFHRTFKRTMGVTPGQYAARILDTCRERRPDDGSSRSGEEGLEGCRTIAEIYDINTTPDRCDLKAASKPNEGLCTGKEELGSGKSFEVLLAGEDKDEESAEKEEMRHMNGLFLSTVEQQIFLDIGDDRELFSIVNLNSEC